MEFDFDNPPHLSSKDQNRLHASATVSMLQIPYKEMTVHAIVFSLDICDWSPAGTLRPIYIDLFYNFLNHLKKLFDNVPDLFYPPHNVR